MKTDQKNKITPDSILFIKLGKGGKFEKECLERDILKIDYKEIDHKICLKGDWEEVKRQIIRKIDKREGVATYHLNQIKHFYESPGDVLWVTFINNKLYWCFSEKKLSGEKGGFKIRKVIGKWSCENINKEILFLEDISGTITKTSGFRGTICRIANKEYIVKKINSEEQPDVVEARKAFQGLKNSIVPVIQKLNYKDFEVLVDLIFSNFGWQRTSVLGKTQKSIDLALVNPINNERAVVQVKCQGNFQEFKKYKNKFLDFSEYDKFFYVVHTPQDDIEKYRDEAGDIKIFFAEEIAEFVINAGLLNWLMRKVN